MKIGLFTIVNTDNEKYFEDWQHDSLEYSDRPYWTDSRLNAWNTTNLDKAMAYKLQLLELGYPVDVLAFDGTRVK